jgi:hypothetical protein
MTENMTHTIIKARKTLLFRINYIQTGVFSPVYSKILFLCSSKGRTYTKMIISRAMKSVMDTARL